MARCVNCKREIGQYDLPFTLVFQIPAGFEFAPGEIIAETCDLTVDICVSCNAKLSRCVYRQISASAIRDALPHANQHRCSECGGWYSRPTGELGRCSLYACQKCDTKIEASLREGR